MVILKETCQVKQMLVHDFILLNGYITNFVTKSSKCQKISYRGTKYNDEFRKIASDKNAVAIVYLNLRAVNRFFKVSQ